MTVSTNEFLFLEIRFTDLDGRLRSITIPLSEPCSTIEEVENDSSFAKGTSVDGSSVKGFADVENSDLSLSPDKGSTYAVPYSSRRAACHCTIYQRGLDNNKENIFLGDPRTVLKNTLSKILPENGILKIKPEPEFFIFDGEEANDSGGYADVYPSDLSTELMDDFAETLLMMGINPKEIHHENGPSQQEIELDFAEALENADNLMKFKNITKALAENSNLQVTFMPKPFGDECGSGLHFHLQLWQDGKNLFGAEDGEISEFAKHFIAGILKHADSLTAILNPTVNSYKRLIPGYEAPVYKCWGYRNRTALIRIPLFRKAEKAAIEIRSPDFTGNPYLILSSLVVAGMDGVNNKLEPIKPISADVFHLTVEERLKNGISNIPQNLGEALAVLKKNKLLLDHFGSLMERFIDMKEKEWQEYVNLTITEFDYKKYFDC